MKETKEKRMMNNMLYYNKFNEVKTASKFVKIMNSDEDITLVVENKNEFAMILKPKSWRFDDCYSVSMVARDKNNANKGLTMIHKSVLTTDEITELHCEKSGADFKNMFNKNIKELFKCNVYEIDKPMNIIMINNLENEDY